MAWPVEGRLRLAWERVAQAWPCMPQPEQYIIHEMVRRLGIWRGVMIKQEFELHFQTHYPGWWETRMAAFIGQFGIKEQELEVLEVGITVYYLPPAFSVSLGDWFATTDNIPSTCAVRTYTPGPVG